MSEFLANAGAADWATAGAALVTLASFLANLFPKSSVLGKVVHFLALNFKTHQ